MREVYGTEVRRFAVPEERQEAVAFLMWAVHEGFGRAEDFLLGFGNVDA